VTVCFSDDHLVGWWPSEQTTSDRRRRGGTLRLYSRFIFRSYPLINSRVDINRLKDTSYEVIISVLITDDDITAQSTLDCELRIPDTPYVKRKTFVFFQGKLTPPHSPPPSLS